MSSSPETPKDDPAKSTWDRIDKIARRIAQLGAAFAVVIAAYNFIVPAHLAAVPGAVLCIVAAAVLMWLEPGSSSLVKKAIEGSAGVREVTVCVLMFTSPVVAVSSCIAAAHCLDAGTGLS